MVRSAKNHWALVVLLVVAAHMIANASSSILYIVARAAFGPAMTFACVAITTVALCFAVRRATSTLRWWLIPLLASPASGWVAVFAAVAIFGELVNRGLVRL